MLCTVPPTKISVTIIEQSSNVSIVQETKCSSDSNCIGDVNSACQSGVCQCTAGYVRKQGTCGQNTLKKLIGASVIRIITKIEKADKII